MLRKIFGNQRIWAGIYCLYLAVLLIIIITDKYYSLEFQSLTIRIIVVFIIEAIIPVLLYKAIRYFIFANDKD